MKYFLVNGHKLGLDRKQPKQNRLDKVEQQQGVLNSTRLL